MREPLIDRRTVLRGAGVAIALPWLEAMLPRGIASSALAATTATEAAPPLRVAYLFFPNGVNVEAWTPTADARGLWVPSPTLAPLADFRGDIDVYTGLRHRHAEANGDGPGDHARSAACFLTGMQPKKTAGDDIRAGKSIDQVIADDLAEQGVRTRLRSLELGSEPAMTAGNCDSGYSCAYSANISWKSESLPNGKETDPRTAFDRIFGKRGQSPEEAAAQARSRRSILDGAMKEAKRLSRQVGAADRARLDEYLEGVRDLESRLGQDALADLDAPLAAASARLAGHAPGEGDAPHPLVVRKAALEACRAAALQSLPLIRSAQNADARSAETLKACAEGLTVWRDDWKEALGLSGKRPKSVRPDGERMSRVRNDLKARIDRAVAELTVSQNRRAEVEARMEALLRPL